MLFNKDSVILYCCPSCGAVLRQKLNLFLFATHTEHMVTCTQCEAAQLNIYKKKRNAYCITIPCAECGGNHTYTLSSNKIWAPLGSTYKCPSTQRDIMFVGAKALSKKFVKDVESREAGLFSYYDFNEEFLKNASADAQIIMETVDFLDQMAVKGNIMCECGSTELDLQIEANRITVFCAECGNSYHISTDTPDELAAMKNLGSIILTRNTV